MCVCPLFFPYVQFVNGEKKVLFSINLLSSQIKQPYYDSFSMPELLSIKKYYQDKDFYFDPYLKQDVKLLDVFAIPCGKCIDCLKTKSIHLGSRAVMQQMYNKEYVANASSFFITLTFSDFWIRKNNSLSKRDLQLLFKKLRKDLDSNFSFTYFACGEYGSQNMRPHYHLLLMFNTWFSLDNLTILLRKHWKFGLIDIQRVQSNKSAFYISRYCDKKIESGFKLDDYKRLGIVPPFILTSKNLGFQYFLDHLDDILDQGYIQLANGQRVSIPPLFVNKLPESIKSDIKIKNMAVSLDKIAKDVQASKFNKSDYDQYQTYYENMKKNKKSVLKRM